MDAEHAAAQAEIKALRREVEALRGSTSWRVTAPLRGLANVLKRLIRPIARRIVTSHLSAFNQYAPRPLRLPRAYHATTAPADAPSIAIVTPAYNHAAFLAATIDSVISQNYPRLQYIVQDAGSTDGTRDILAGYGARLAWRSEPDGGQASGINAGFRHVSGDIMGWLNSDDLLLPGALATVARCFDAHPDIDFVYGDRIVVDRGGAEIGRIVLPDHDARVLRLMDFVPQETMFWRRRVWDALGGLDETFQYAMDWDFLLRAQGRGFRFLHVRRFLGAFRVHPQQKTHAWAAVGQREERRLREIWVRPDFEPRDIDVGIRRYLLRQVVLHHAYKIGLVRR